MVALYSNSILKRERVCLSASSNGYHRMLVMPFTGEILGGHQGFQGFHFKDHLLNFISGDVGVKRDPVRVQLIWTVAMGCTAGHSYSYSIVAAAILARYHLLPRPAD